MVDVSSPYARTPIQKYFAEVDAKHFDKPYGWFYYDFVPKVPTEWLTNTLLNDMDFSASHQGNFLGVINGGQGSGKSIFGTSLALWLGKKFGFPFDLKRDIFVNPFELDLEIRNPDKDRRRTFMQDEQPQGIAGLGSGLLVRSLKDYEELGRFCLVGETDIFVIENNNLIKKTVAELSGKSFDVLSYNFEDEVFEKDVGECWFDSVDDVTRITLKNGYNKKVVEVNAEHPFFVRREGKLIKIKTKDLKVGDDVFCKKGVSGR
jgi:hypothetical protein